MITRKKPGIFRSGLLRCCRFRNKVNPERDQRAESGFPAGILFVLIYIVILSGCTPKGDPAGPPDYSRKLDYDPAVSLGFRPNIVWLVTEDLTTIVPPFGDSTIVTPNLSRLAREGVRYINVFSCSGVCAPSRCALTTGMYPTSIGGHNMRVQYVKAHMDKLGLILYEVVPPPDVKMMSQILRENGYYCTNNDKQDYQFAPPVTAWDETSLRAHWRNRKPGQPFFAVFNFGCTHEGHVTFPYSNAISRYDDPSFPEINLEEYGDNIQIDSNQWTLQVPGDLDVPVPPYLPSTKPVIAEVRRVYSNILTMDRQIGVILRQLAEDHLLDSTIVVWYGDNGGPLPRQKRLLYDAGIHVPMIIRYPGEEGAGSYDDQLISFVDFAPTTLSMTGIHIPGYMQGQAFAGRYRAAKNREYIFAAADRLDTEVDMIRAVRDKRYKYLRNFFPDRPYYLPVEFRERMATMQELLRLNQQDSLNEYQAQWFRPAKPEEELFDLANDPFELHDIAGDPANHEMVTRMRAACDVWMNRTGDLGHTPEGEIIEMFWPGRIQPVTEAVEYDVKENKVVFTCKTAGANIGFQMLDVGAPVSSHWEIYQEPVPVRMNTRIFAVAHRIGYAPSDTLMIEFQ